MTCNFQLSGDYTFTLTLQGHPDTFISSEENERLILESAQRSKLHFFLPYNFSYPSSYIDEAVIDEALTLFSRVIKQALFNGRANSKKVKPK